MQNAIDEPLSIFLFRARMVRMHKYRILGRSHYTFNGSFDCHYRCVRTVFYVYWSGSIDAFFFVKFIGDGKHDNRHVAGILSSLDAVYCRWSLIDGLICLHFVSQHLRE